MNWEAILFDEAAPGADLAPHIDALFAHERENWTALRDGEAALAQIKTTEYAEDGARVVVQSNAGRRRSTHAKVDAKSVARRPACYSAEGPFQIAVSPAALEMAGVLVVAESDQFRRIDARAARRIYEEVSLNETTFERLVKAVKE